ncbi:hypothetical protein CAP2UW1_0422 [Candidatus Accumulibacter phosphatis]|uniref:Uncharacterized protein n=1 Tax=Accumulibacter regalis TaxID=522306 RepID=C7RKV1_ACCRE
MRMIAIYDSAKSLYDGGASRQKERPMRSLLFNTFLAGLLLWLVMAGI